MMSMMLSRVAEKALKAVEIAVYVGELTKSCMSSRNFNCFAANLTAPVAVLNASLGSHASVPPHEGAQKVSQSSRVFGVVVMQDGSTELWQEHTPLEPCGALMSVLNFSIFASALLPIE